MPHSLSKNADKGGDFVDKKSGGASHEVQMVRENGVVKAISVDGVHRVYEQEVDQAEQALSDHLDQHLGNPLAAHDNYQDVQTYSEDEDAPDLFEIINQAIDKIVEDSPECYGSGWERDVEFVDATVRLVRGEYNFTRTDILRAIKIR